jgi:hypothetical protein
MPSLLICPAVLNTLTVKEQTEKCTYFALFVTIWEKQGTRAIIAHFMVFVVA